MEISKQSLEKAIKILKQAHERTLKEDFTNIEHDIKMTLELLDKNYTKVGKTVRIKSCSGYIELAAENHHEDSKEYFTFEEANAKTIPDGWRLPTRQELEDIKAALIFEKRKVFIEDVEGKERVELPLSGCREDCNNFRGYYWSSTPNGNNAHWLYIDAGSSYILEANKSDSFSVRCVRKLKE